MKIDFNNLKRKALRNLNKLQSELSKLPKPIQPEIRQAFNILRRNVIAFASVYEDGNPENVCVLGESEFDEIPELLAWGGEIECPDCGSDNVDCAVSPWVFRCLDCGHNFKTEVK